MLLRRINKLNNLGLFFQARTNFEIGKAALMYGSNGYGKSTLTAVFRSLAANDALQMNEKTTLHKAGEVSCELLFSETVAGKQNAVEFSCSGWTAADLPKVVVFDARYVADNVYSDFSVTHEHKKNISAIILGQQGVQIAEKITALNKALAETKKRCGDAEVSLASVVPKDAQQRPLSTADEFLAIGDPDVALCSQKEELGRKLGNFDKAEKIQLLQKPKEIEISDVGERFASLGEHLTSALPGVSPEVAARMQKRIADLGDSNAQLWLRQGAHYWENSKEACPYCLRASDGVESLFEDYEQFFSSAYREFTAKASSGCSEALSSLETFFLKSSSIENTVAANRGKLSALNEYLPQAKAEGYATTMDAAGGKLVSAVQTVLACKERVLGECKAKAEGKKSSPLDSQTLAEEVILECIEAHRLVVSSLVGYNGEVRRCAGEIDALQAQKYDVSEKDALVLKLNKIALIESRFLGTTVEIAMRIAEARKERNRLETAIAQEEKNLDDYNKGITEKYLGGVNGLLKKFGARYSVQIPKDLQKRGNSPVLDLAYELFGRQIPSSKFGIFSDSEKRLLAFCFFLVHLESLPGLEDYIVVIDDPFSSFDDDNIKKLVYSIGELVAKVSQVIVLSHYSRPLVSFIDNTPVAWSQMEITFDPTSGSDIVQCDIKKKFGDAHAAKMDELEHFRTTAIPSERVANIVQDVRVAIEHEIKVRYRKFLKVAVEAGATTLGSLIDELEKLIQDKTITKLDVNAIAEMRRLNTWTSQEHHSDPDGADASFTPEDARKMIEDSMALIYERL